MHKATWRPVVLLAALTLGGCSSNRPTAWRPIPAAPGGRAPITPTSSDFEPHRASPTLSAIGVHGLFDAPFAAMILAGGVLWWIGRRRARVQASVDPVAPLIGGPAVVVGVVELEHDQPQGAAVELRIEQVGTETKAKNRWSHQWTEISREVRTHPFTILRDDGTRVRVEPDDEVAVHDELSRVEQVDLTLRLRIAEVVPGERVHVTGTVSGAATKAPQGVYRRGQGELVLRRPTLGRMVISAEPPGDTESKRASFHARWAVALAGIWLFFNLIALAEYRVISVTGGHVVATAIATQAWEEHVNRKNKKPRWEPHFAVRARYQPPGGAPLILEGECSKQLHDCLAGGGCTELPFVVSSRAPSFHAIGERPTTETGPVAFIAVVTALLALLYGAATRWSRPWYLASKVIDGGSGRLRGPAT